MKLFVFDFDNTIVSEHTHNLIMSHIDSLKDKPEKQWNLIKDIPPIGSPEEWQQLFANLLKSGNKIAIASYNAFGRHLIPQYLSDVLGIPSDTLKQIQIESWSPPNEKAQAENGKNQHIQNLLAHFSDPKPEVVLIDDSWDMLDKANEKGYSTIYADLDGRHIRETEKALTSSPVANKSDSAFERSANSSNTSSTGLQFTYTEEVAFVTHNSQPSIIFTRENKEIHRIPDVSQDTSIRDVMSCLESQQVLPPTFKTRYNFFVNKKDLEYNKNVDKPFHKVVDALYENTDTPTNITIDLVRKS